MKSGIVENVHENDQLETEIDPEIGIVNVKDGIDQETEADDLDRDHLSGPAIEIVTEVSHHRRK